MTPDGRGVEINMSGIPVNGIGGLGLVAVALLMTVVLPDARWLLVLGASGGVVLAVAIVLARRHHVPSGPSGDDPTILFRPEPVGGQTRGSDQGQTRVRPGSDQGQTRVRPESDISAPGGVPLSLPLGALTILSTPVRDRS